MFLRSVELAIVYIPHPRFSSIISNMTHHIIKKFPMFICLEVLNWKCPGGSPREVYLLNITSHSQNTCI